MASAKIGQKSKDKGVKVSQISNEELISKLESRSTRPRDRRIIEREVFKRGIN